jgi:hypothetical protein
MSSLSFLRRMSLSKGKKRSSKASVTSIPSDVVIPPLDDVTVQETGPEPLFAPETQKVLLLHAARQPYELTHDYPVPEVQGDDEVLVRTQAIGLNPIDWKAPYVPNLTK